MVAKMKRKMSVQISVLSLFLLLVCSLAAQSSVIFVKPGGDGSGNGSSWDDAEDSVQHALTYRALTTGDQIWVAAGTYFENIVWPTPRPARQVSIYGGFDGTETALSQRDWIANETILDGGNSGRIIYMSPNAHPSAASNIDGFIFQNGLGQSAGAIQTMDTASPTIQHNVFRWNTGTLGAGAILSNPNCCPLIKNNIFYGNDGGNASAIQTVGTGNALIYNNTFIDNGNSGNYNSLGCVVVWDVAPVMNNIFAYNSSGVDYGPSIQMVRNNCFYMTGSGDLGYDYITVDPQLVSDSSPYDFHLESTSPCIDAGITSYNTLNIVGAYDRDFFDYDRINGTTVDIGASEY